MVKDLLKTHMEVCVFVRGPPPQKKKTGVRFSFLVSLEHGQKRCSNSKHYRPLLKCVTALQGPKDIATDWAQASVPFLGRHLLFQVGADVVEREKDKVQMLNLKRCSDFRPIIHPDVVEREHARLGPTERTLGH